MSDMYSKPWTFGGTKPLSSFGCAFLAPRMVWVDGLVKSRSNNPTLHPFLASVSASVVAMRFFPTPPFPDETAMIRVILARRWLIMLVLGSVMVIVFLLRFRAKFLGLG